MIVIKQKCISLKSMPHSIAYKEIQKTLECLSKTYVADMNTRVKHSH